MSEDIFTLNGAKTFQNLQLAHVIKARHLKANSNNAIANLFAVSVGATQSLKQAKKVKFENAEVKTKVLSKLTKIANSTNNIVDNFDDFEEAELKTHLARLKKRISFVTSACKEEANAAFKEEVTAISLDDFEEMSEPTTPQEEKTEIDTILRKHAHIIDRMQHHAQNLPKTLAELKTTFGIYKVPLVIIGNAFTSDYEKIGLPVEALSNYTVLNNQLVIGVHPNRTHGEPVPTFVNRVIKQLTSKTGTKYMVMNGVSGYKDTGMIYYWIFPEKEADRFLHTTGKAFAIKKWGFAFK